MDLRIKRVILFVENVAKVLPFYRDVLGLRVVEETDDGKWAELDAGACRIALHAGGAPATKKPQSKIVFGTNEVGALREELIARGAKLSEVKRFGALELCDGVDPEGHAFQLSNRP